MAKNTFIQSATRSFNKIGFQMKKHSPEILVVAGVIGTVTSAILACRATTKVSAVLAETKEGIDTIHGCLKDPEMAKTYEKKAGKKYTEEDHQKDLAIVYAQTGLKIAKLYAPSVILGALSLTSILASNNILRKRNIALAAAYATVDRGFKEYRGRVVERFGEAVDRELKYNVKAMEVEEVVVDEKGKEKKVKKTINVTDVNGYSGYARFFDEGSKEWTKNSEYNLMFLRAQQQYANDLLQARGYVFLNEVYDMLGINKTQAGQSVGWIYDPEHPARDGYIDFGIYDMYKEKARDFVNGYEKVILLDFNVDGPILDILEK